MKIHITSFYQFDNMTEAEVANRFEILKKIGGDQNLKGLVLIGTEGFNLTVSGTESGIQKFKQLFFETWGYKDVLVKDSVTSKHPFKHFRVQIRKEIVTLGVDGIEVPRGRNRHISPLEWHQMMEQEEVVVIDTRNWYETQVGKFKNAVDLNISEFRQFPKALKDSGLPKNKNYLIYCTGGIRCEKAIEEMRQQGYENVNQLEGGILKYIEEFPNGKFEGECFVFDHRVAVNQNLEPSQNYRLCPHCGQPGTLKIECLRCDHSAIVCSKCAEFEYNRTCSKNCSHHYRVRPGIKGPHQKESLYYDTKNS